MLLSSQEDQVLLHLWERTGVTQLTGEQVLLHLRERLGVTQLTGELREFHQRDTNIKQ